MANTTKYGIKDQYTIIENRRTLYFEECMTYQKLDLYTCLYHSARKHKYRNTNKSYAPQQSDDIATTPVVN